MTEKKKKEVSNKSKETFPSFLSLNEKLQKKNTIKKKIQDQERQDQERYDIIHNFNFKQNEIIQNYKTNSFDQNSISTLLNATELKNTPMSYAMVFPPQPFQTPLLDKYDSDYDKEVFKITIYFFCHAQDTYRSARHFIKGNYLCCAEKLKSIFEHFSDTIPMQSSLSLTSGQSSLFPYKGYDDPLNHILTPDKDLWKNNDLFIKENSFIENVLFPLVQSYYKINTLFLSYFPENLHCIVETGLMPPLQNTDDESLQKWVLFQRNLFVSEKKNKNFYWKNCQYFHQRFSARYPKNFAKNCF